MRQQFLLPGENLSIRPCQLTEPSCRVLVFTQRYRLQATLDCTTTIAAGRCTPLLTIWLTRFVAKGKAGGLTPASPPRHSLEAGAQVHLEAARR